MVTINIQKKYLFLISALIVFLAGVVVIAVNPSTKPNPGHYSQEVTVNINGVDKTLQAAIDAGDFGGLGAPDYDSNWQDFPLENEKTFTTNVNLAPENQLVYILGKDAGTNETHQAIYGGEKGDANPPKIKWGASISKITLNSIVIRNGRKESGYPAWGKIRIKIWKIQ